MPGRGFRPKRFNSALVPFVLALVRRAGRDTAALEKKYLTVRGDDGVALPQVSLDELGALLTDAAKAVGDPLFGLHAAQAMSRGSYGLLEFALRAAPTGLVAMQQLATYGALINPLVRWSLEDDGAEVSLHHRAPRKGGVGAQGNVFTVTRILQIAREMMGDDVKPAHVWLSHAAKECPAELATFLGTTRVTFGCASNGLSFERALLERVPVGADPELNRALEAHGAAVLAQCGELDDARERVRGVVVELLPVGGVTLPKVAKRLHVTARTLQRRLQEDGLSFAALLQDVRRAQAERLLMRSDAPLSEVAAQVGYADTAAFARAFKGWTGATPGRFRQAR